MNRQVGVKVGTRCLSGVNSRIDESFQEFQWISEIYHCGSGSAICGLEGQITIPPGICTAKEPTNAVVKMTSRLYKIAKNLPGPK